MPADKKPLSPLNMTEPLLGWYDLHHRKLPWREVPVSGTQVNADPYRVWLSEIMLQQTTVEAVKAFFAKFVGLWPDVHSMAKADQDDIMKAWAGLGYYTRARNLKKCADLIAANGGYFPADETDLRKLPGIGPYTSAAIAAIAFGEKAIVIDGNIERVMTRLCSIETPLPLAKVEIRAALEDLVPASRPGDFAQAMMDLGATICTPKRPACALCPLNENCLAFHSSEQESFPVKAPKAIRPTRYGSAFIAKREDGAILLRKRPDKGLLGGMTEIPGSIWEIDHQPSTDEAPFQSDWARIGQITHVFTHFTLELTVFLTRHEGETADDFWWSGEEEVRHEALPTVMKKAIEKALPGLFKSRRPKPSG